MGTISLGPTTPTQFSMPTGSWMEKMLEIGNFKRRSPVT